MTFQSIDQKNLEAFLALGGPDMRDALINQVMSDLRRCHAALDPESGAQDFDSLCKTAHEIKGIATTIGATQLKSIAEQTENACTKSSSDKVADLVPELKVQALLTVDALSTLMQD